MVTSLLESLGLGALWPWRAAFVAGLAALAWGLVFRLAGGGRRGWSAAAAAVGLCAGWLSVLPPVAASPRQLVERLPLLVLAAFAGGLAVEALRSLWPRLAAAVLPACGVLAMLGCGWWMAGAPVAQADLWRAAPVAAGVAAGAGLALWRLRDAWRAAAVAAALAAGLWAGRAAAGPGVLLAVAALLASAGAALAVRAADLGVAARGTLALGLAALAALPVLARGRAADWAAAAAPALAMLLGPAIGGRLPGRRLGPAIGWVAAAAPAVVAAAFAASRIP
ncbi:hypothetical protein [Caldovatus aquaticus]|uniref:Uncharacterized protein n=1 Tax=Caldovatus aquaticus TaxID=2865671 RepID=A0ABS7F031_9PROT|nr:hypothetical protein [Caldovatus aquaticus]MBW8268961.1 hypothetical protein [Caldovatus aquaticus]